MWIKTNEKLINSRNVFTFAIEKDYDDDTRYVIVAYSTSDGETLAKFDNKRSAEAKLNELYRALVNEEAQYEFETAYSMSIDELDLSVRSYNALRRANIRTVYQLKSVNLKNIRNLGKKSIEEIKDTLKKHEIY